MDYSIIKFDIVRNRWKWFALSLFVMMIGAVMTNFWSPGTAFQLTLMRKVALGCLAAVVVGLYCARKFVKNNMLRDFGTFLGILFTFILMMIAVLDTAGFNWGVDFTGGQRLDIKFQKNVTTTEVSNTLKDLGVKFNPIQLSSPTQAIIRWRPDSETMGAYFVFQNQVDPAKVIDALKELKFNPGNFSDLGSGRILVKGVNIEGKTDVVQKTLTEKIGPLAPIPEHTYAEGQLEILTQAMGKKIGPYEIISKSDIGPSIGEALRKSALIAIIIASLGILIYVWYRFEIAFAMGGIMALLHDACVVVSMYGLFRWEVNGTFVAVVLTILGYSINDTVVIFDRIRENRTKFKRENPIDIMNVSMWQTMRRSLFTSLTTIIAIGAVAVFGGYTIRDFAMALMIGIASGTYSSVMTATPLLTFFSKYEKAYEASLKTAGKAKAADYGAPTASRTSAPAATAERIPSGSKSASSGDDSDAAQNPYSAQKKKKDKKRKLQRRR